MLSCRKKDSPPIRETEAPRFEFFCFPGVKGAFRCVWTAAAVWSPSLRPWRQQMLICRGVGGGLWPNGEPHRSSWGAPWWSWPLMPSPPWLWTWGKKYRNEDRDRTATKDGLIRDPDSLLSPCDDVGSNARKRSEMVGLSFGASFNSSQLSSLKLGGGLSP